MGFYQQLESELKETRRRVAGTGHHHKKNGAAAAVAAPPPPAPATNGKPTTKSYRSSAFFDSPVRTFATTSYRVPGIVPPIRQPTSNSCWATSTAIMVGWRDGQSVPIETVMSNLGQVWLDRFNANQPLWETDKAAFLAASGLQAEPPMSYSIDGWVQLLRVYGPLFVTTSEIAGHPMWMHVRVMVGITTDGSVEGTTLQIVDPGPGSEYSEKLTDFQRKFEAEPSVPNSPLVLQVVHWPSGTRTVQQSRYFAQTASYSNGTSEARSYTSRAFDAPKPQAWGAKVSQGFRDKVRQIASNLGTDPDFMMACMAFETGETFSPSIKNAAGSGATGLIQFMPSTAQALGTTVDQLAAMSAEQQLDYVEKYFQPYKNRLSTIQDVYMAILWPKAVGQPDDYELFSRTSRPRTYEQNRGLDRNGDGVVTKQEAAASAVAKLTKGQRQENAI